MNPHQAIARRSAWGSLPPQTRYPRRAQGPLLVFVNPAASERQRNGERGRRSEPKVPRGVLQRGSTYPPRDVSGAHNRTKNASPRRKTNHTRTTCVRHVAAPRFVFLRVRFSEAVSFMCSMTSEIRCCVSAVSVPRDTRRMTWRSTGDSITSATDSP